MPKFLRVSPIKLNEVEIQTFADHVRSCTVGIDCHRDSYHVYFLHLDSVSKDIHERYCKFGVGLSDLAGIENFLRECVTVTGHDVELVILESTGPYSRPLFELLARQYPTCMINPLEFSKYGRKTDKFDARKMAVLALQGLFTKSFLTTVEEEQLKIVSRSAIRARRMMTRENNSLGSILVQLGFGITRGEATISLLSASGRLILDQIVHGQTDPKKCAEAALYYNPEYIADGGVKGDARKAKFAALVDGLEGVRTLNAQTRDLIGLKHKMTLEYEQTYMRFLTTLDQLMVSYVGENGMTGKQAVDYLATIPSISQKSGMFVVAEVGLRIKERYGSPQEKGVGRFISYCGLSPQRQYSADKETSSRKSVSGNKFTRSLFVECGQSLMKSNHALGERCRAIERRNGGAKSGTAKKIAVVAAANQLAKACYWVLYKQAPFDDSAYDYTAVLKQKEKRLERVLKDFKQVLGDLGQENSDLATTIKSRAAGVLGGCPYQLKADNLFVSLDLLFKGATLTALKKVGCRTFADIWALVSSDRLASAAGIGKKRYSDIITTCLQKGYLRHVGEL